MTPDERWTAAQNRSKAAVDAWEQAQKSRLPADFARAERLWSEAKDLWVAWRLAKGIRLRASIHLREPPDEALETERLFGKAGQMDDVNPLGVVGGGRSDPCR